MIGSFYCQTSEAKKIRRTLEKLVERVAFTLDAKHMENHTESTNNFSKKFAQVVYTNTVALGNPKKTLVMTDDSAN